MRVELKRIPVREALHFLGWRGAPIEPELLAELRALCDRALGAIEPRVRAARFALELDGGLAGASFVPEGNDVRALLTGCHEAILLAATLGAAGERLLLREQALDAGRALLLDAVLSAAIEAVCDEAEAQLREEAKKQGLYLTDRFSPGYGDMPIGQTRAICDVLQADRAIGLTVSSSGIMMPRKSVTAVMGVSRTMTARRPSGCEGCGARETCPLNRTKAAQRREDDDV